MDGTIYQEDKQFDGMFDFLKNCKNYFLTPRIHFMPESTLLNDVIDSNKEYFTK